MVDLLSTPKPQTFSIIISIINYTYNPIEEVQTK